MTEATPDMVTVPREPTPEMIEAGRMNIYDQSGDTRADEVYADMIAAAPAHQPDAQAIRNAALDEAKQVCHDQIKIFLSERYKVGQPLSSMMERFACEQCADAIEALKGTKP